MWSMAATNPTATMPAVKAYIEQMIYGDVLPVQTANSGDDPNKMRVSSQVGSGGDRKSVV